MSGDVPEGWSVKKLGEVADLIMGQSPPSASVSESGEGLPFIQGNAEFGARHPTPRFVASTTPKVVQKNDLLISVRAPVGELNIAEGPLCIGRGVGGIRARGCDSDFLFYAVRGLSKEFARLSQGSTFDAINGAELRAIEILVPPVDEQRRIAKVLRSVDEAVCQTRKVHLQSENVLYAYLASAFSAVTAHEDKGKTLEEILSEIIDYRGVPPPKAPNGVPLLTAKNVRFGFLDPEPREFIAECDYDVWMRRGIPKRGDIMFTTEAPLGYVAEFPDYKAALGQRTLTLRPNPAYLISSYLKWLLLSPSAQDLIHSHATGSTAKGIKQKTFRKLRFVIHDLDEQVGLSAVCDSLWSTVENSKRIVKQLEFMKAIISRDLLSGDVRLPHE